MIVRQFLLWARTAPDAARAKAISALARAYTSADLGAADRAALETALPLLAADPSPDVRLALASALSRHPLVPVDIVLTLAELDGEAGQVMLTHSPVLNTRELIEFCESGDAVRQAAIASREGLPAPVAAALAETGHAEACLALVRNVSADIPGFALGRIVVRHGHVGTIREALLARPDLPAAAHQAVIRAVAGTLSSFVAQRQWLEPDVAARVVREACDSAAVETAGREGADVRALVEILKSQGELTPALALRSLLSGQVRMFLETVSVLSGLPTDRIAALAADRSGDAFRVLYNRIGLPAGAYLAFRTALEVLQREDYVDEADEEEAGLKRRIVDTVLDRYASQGETDNKLVGVLERWKENAVRDARERREQRELAA
ncbi:DUF2336 domain-containing protein [Ancylobacter mangrovi]|uniref:DUF2336 domain-containing protein n=1 Tax=Ancylobacter mangrovi TaxID=2972472 RepID=UPI002162079C|nr:DUF2336 domain-containing protein [Ancylobacter mangrovi]MCS0501883.1 DUF2336 domain-containing protein [Ancylobacter mangrovi]